MTAARSRAGPRDDGSGVVAILEGLRALGERGQLRNDLIVLLTDAEEVGLLGARAFVDEHPWMDDVALVVSIEMRGGGGPSMMFETGAENGWVIEALRQADPYPSANSVGYEIYQRMTNDTDFTPFKEAGKQGLNFAGLGRAHVYHQVYDTPENFDERTLQHPWLTRGGHAATLWQRRSDGGRRARCQLHLCPVPWIGDVRRTVDMGAWFRGGGRMGARGPGGEAGWGSAEVYCRGLRGHGRTGRSSGRGRVFPVRLA